MRKWQHKLCVGILLASMTMSSVPVMASELPDANTQQAVEVLTEANVAEETTANDLNTEAAESEVPAQETPTEVETPTPEPTEAPEAAPAETPTPEPTQEPQKVEEPTDPVSEPEKQEPTKPESGEKPQTEDTKPETPKQETETPASTNPENNEQPDKPETKPEAPNQELETPAPQEVEQPAAPTQESEEPVQDIEIHNTNEEEHNYEPVWHEEWKDRASEFAIGQKYERIETKYVQTTVKLLNVREVPNASSQSTKVAQLKEGAIVRLIDDSDENWWFIETKDADGEIVRGYSSSRFMEKLPKKEAVKIGEDASLVIRIKDNTHPGFSAVAKTTYKELVGQRIVSSRRTELVNYALQFLGNPYVWGGESLTNGCDCSGFSQGVYAHFGIDLPRCSYEQCYTGTKIAVDDAQPGDLLFYSDGSSVYHVMICLSNDGNGNIQVVHAQSEKTGIVVSDLNKGRACWATTYEALEEAPAEHSKDAPADIAEWTSVGECRLTSYCYECNTPENSAITASGIPATEWHTVAVDKSVIPLGSQVYIEGYGTFVAEDTGVKGNWCDLYVHNDECHIWDTAQVYFK